MTCSRRDAPGPAWLETQGQSTAGKCPQGPDQLRDTAQDEVVIFFFSRGLFKGVPGAVVPWRVSRNCEISGHRGWWKSLFLRGEGFFINSILLPCCIDLWFFKKGEGEEDDDGDDDDRLLLSSVYVNSFAHHHWRFVSAGD